MKMLFGMYNRCKSATRVMLFGNKSYKKKAKLLTVKERLVRLNDRIDGLWSNSNRVEDRITGNIDDRCGSIEERIYMLEPLKKQVKSLEDRLHGHKVSMELSIIDQNKMGKEVYLINTVAQNNANKLIELETKLEKTTTVIYSLLNNKADRRGRKVKK